MPPDPPKRDRNLLTKSSEGFNEFAHCASSSASLASGPNNRATVGVNADIAIPELCGQLKSNADSVSFESRIVPPIPANSARDLVDKQAIPIQEADSNPIPPLPRRSIAVKNCVNHALHMAGKIYMGERYIYFEPSDCPGPAGVEPDFAESGTGTLSHISLTTSGGHFGSARGISKECSANEKNPSCDF